MNEFSCKAIQDLVFELMNTNALKNKIFVAGGIVPYIYSSEDSGRAHADIDIVVKDTDMPFVREYLKDNGYYQGDFDSIEFSYNSSHVDYGISVTDKEKEWIQCMNCVNRRTESSDECFYCPIAEGCSWCSAYNYQVFGTPDSRATYICDMHKARSLANVYFWNKYYDSKGYDKVFSMHCPKEWALQIVSESEYEMLLNLSDQRTIMIGEQDEN